MLPIIYADIIDDPVSLSRFESIYRQYAGEMFATANRILKDPFESEDAVQDAFLGVARHMNTVSRIREERDLRWYLHAAAHNAALNRLPRKKPGEELVSLEDAPELSGGDLWQELCDRLDAEALTGVLASLPRTYREALYFHFVLEFSVKETADALQIKVPAAKQRLVRGKRLLAQRIREKGCFDHVPE